MDIVNQVLELASTGAYSADIQKELSDEFLTREILVAIRVARRKGMYTVPDMRDEDKGTYYQFDGDIGS